VVADQVAYRATGDTLDLGYVTTTNALAVPPRSPTPVSLALSGLQSWASDDRIQLFSWGANSWDLFDPKLGAGTTAATVTEDWSAPALGYGALNLLGPSDRLYVIQYATTQQAGSGRVYYHAVGTTSLTGISMSNGQGTSATPPALTAPSDAASLTVDWRTSQFESAMTTPMQPLGHELTVYALIPGPAGESPFASSPNLLDYFPPLNQSGTGTPDQQVNALVYSRFMPPQYKDVVYAGWVGTVGRGSPLDGSSTSIDAFVTRSDLATALPSPLTPLISGIRAVQIAGKDAGNPQTGVGLTPVVSWTPPAVGTPSRYVVQLFTFPSGSGDPQLVTTLNLPGSTTSVQIPAGVQQTGKAYFVRIVAQAGVGSDAAPLRARLPSGAAAYVTQTYVP
jgi:hypothetical protein